MIKGNAAIDMLIEKLHMTEQSDRNKNRSGAFPRLLVGLEEPIAQVKLFSRNIDRYYSDPEYYVEQTLRNKLWAFENIDDETQVDTAINANLGHYPEYTYLGMSVSFNHEGVPILSTHPRLETCPDMSTVEPVEFGRTGWMPRQIEWFERICEIVDGRVDVRFQTWSRGCLDLGIQMRGYNNFMTDIAERPEFIHELLGFITTQRINWFAGYCAKFGVGMPPANIMDDWLNVPFISPAFFEEYVLPQYLRLEEAHGNIGNIHSCGNKAPLQKHMLKLKSLGGFEVNYWTSLEDTLANVPPEKRISISVHPNDVLYSDTRAIETKIARILILCKGRRCSGIGTNGLTPVEVNDAERDFLSRIRIYMDAFRRAREKAI